MMKSYPSLIFFKTGSYDYPDHPDYSDISQYMGMSTTELCEIRRCRRYPDGTAVIKDLKFNEENVTFDFGMLVVLDVLFRVLAYVCLLIRTRMS